MDAERFENCVVARKALAAIVFSLTRTTMTVVLFILLLSLVSLGNCQSLPQFEHDGFDLFNNSFIYYIDIGDDIGGRNLSLKCVTDSVNCCDNTDVGGWRDESGRPVYQGADGATCLYVTRGDGVISLHRKRGCYDHTPGLWRCDIPDSSGHMQSLYAYISNDRSYGKLHYCAPTFTKPKCRTTGLAVYELHSTH